MCAFFFPSVEWGIGRHINSSKLQVSSDCLVAELFKIFLRQHCLPILSMINRVFNSINANNFLKMQIPLAEHGTLNVLQARLM